ncbi:PTS sugar transporter subunit IIC [Lactobacillus sp. ESL0791]|uniref:PTS mannose/fructose/sorbose/N-acetylgalactosamine transporter subunit IIC n=1 Tax=Lactobacillus sp. ESL0791 TaxID=2983234 RepID=UPI0023F89F41|nr:PTS sugar transporter subunit IIC [Lactobacillus sp. ESL0791]MDF7637852.1 PTS sugar transporter subunit IIC [Lactobacillus sp. ESL0791]
MSIVKIALIAAVAEFICFGGNWVTGQSMLDQPIVIGPLVGLLLGDLHTGIILGTSLEAVFLGAANVGGAVALNPSIATTLAVTFAIVSGSNSESVAIAIAVPLGLLGGVFEVGVNALFSFFVPIWNKAAAEGNDKKIVRVHYIAWFLKYLIFSVVVFVTIVVGIKPVSIFVKSLPIFVEKGLSLTGGLLPAVGFAMLLKMVWSNKLSIFFLFGFVMAEYMKLPLIALAVIGLVITLAIAYVDIDILKVKQSKEVIHKDISIDHSDVDEEEDFLS